MLLPVRCICLLLACEKDEKIANTQIHTHFQLTVFKIIVSSFFFVIFILFFFQVSLR